MVLWGGAHYELREQLRMPPSDPEPRGHMHKGSPWGTSIIKTCLETGGSSHQHALRRACSAHLEWLSFGRFPSLSALVALRMRS